MIPTKYSEILELVESIDPVKYGKTRNFLDGAVTKLSPYISRGVISTKHVSKSVLKRGYHPTEIETFLKELAWRDYFQQVWIELGSKIDNDVKQAQTKVSHYEIPENVLQAQTGIQAIDDGITRLYETGYMHNHVRMYVAGVACNVGRSHWRKPAQWMYYHLLDADWASNSLSWQWVAGSFSSKKYYANQENINRYCYSAQQGTFLDVPYEAFEAADIPKELSKTTDFSLKTELPTFKASITDNDLPFYIYDFYNLDCNWDLHVNANRVLLLEPAFFEQYPVSSKAIDFILELSKNIDQIQVIVGDFDEVFKSIPPHQIHFKEHPTHAHYKGIQHSRDWMFDSVKGYYPSFFAYWKKCEKQLYLLTEEDTEKQL